MGYIGSAAATGRRTGLREAHLESLCLDVEDVPLELGVVVDLGGGLEEGALVGVEMEVLGRERELPGLGRGVRHWCVCKEICGGRIGQVSGMRAGSAVVRCRQRRGRRLDLKTALSAWLGRRVRRRRRRARLVDILGGNVWSGYARAILISFPMHQLLVARGRRAVATVVVLGACALSR